MRTISAGLALLAALAAAPPVLAQGLELKGPTGTVTLTNLDGLPRAGVTIRQHDQGHAFEGALLGDLVAKVGAAQGKAIHGPELATVIRVTAADGYQVVLGLAETDPATRADKVILADRADGAPLKDDGPFRLVVEGDLRPARAARNVVRIEVLRLATSAALDHH